MLLAHGAVFIVDLLAFSALSKQQNVGIYQTIKGFNINVHSSSNHMLYLKDVGGLREIIFKKMECLVQDICRHRRAWSSIWSKMVLCGQC